MTKRRTQVLEIHSLDHRWHDKDEVLLHAAFQMLADFIEKEQPDRSLKAEAFCGLEVQQGKPP